MTVFGIDFGTCYSCIAIAESGREPRVIPTAQGENTLPSVVEFRLTKHGKPRVGSGAKNAMTPVSDNVAAFLKTEMDKEESAQTYRVRDNETRSISPIEFAACIYKELQLQSRTLCVAEQQNNDYRAVITVPAVCSEIQREKTKIAAELAGWNVIKVITEPTAAAISYRINEGETIMVFDLGGGTHDVSIVQRVDKDNYQVIVTKGDSCLGGKDWDEKLVELAYKKLGLMFSKDVLTHSRLIEFERHKINLCSSDDISFAFIDDDGVQHQVSLSLEEFEEFTEPLVERAIKVASNAADETVRDHPNVVINRICMSGGACRMPALSRALHQSFKRIPVAINDPDRAVATGAAVYALSLSEEGHGKYEVTERGHAYGFKTYNSNDGNPVIENFINIFDPLEIKSHTIRKYMSVTSDKQRITIFENTDTRSVFPWRGENVFFDCVLQFDRRRTVGSPLDITFERDSNGLVSIIVEADGKISNFSFATTAGSISSQIIDRVNSLILLMEQ